MFQPICNVMCLHVKKDDDYGMALYWFSKKSIKGLDIRVTNVLIMLTFLGQMLIELLGFW
jgi:hypothetical protein